MLSIVLPDLLRFVLAIGGLALPAWNFLGKTAGPERLALALGAGLILGYLALFGLYVADLPLRWFWALPAAGLLFAVVRPAALKGLGRDPAVRRLLGSWLLLSVWCLGWHSLIVSYSGAGWTGDWTEHFQRTNFFLVRWPTDFLFLEYYPLPARPPLVNVWTAGLMTQSGGGFAHFQVFMTLLSTLVIFPLAVLLSRWRDDRRSQWLLLALLMLSPMLVQNTTFPWTKLCAAFFVLLAVTQLSPGRGPLSRGQLIAGALFLTGGMLAHYSAGPWICALGVAGAWLERSRWRERRFQVSVLLAAGLAGLLFATWIGWALVVYGPATTFTANTAVSMAPAGSLTERLIRAAANCWFTVSPIAGDTNVPLLLQTSRLGQWRDYWFLLYQVKLSFAIGTAGGAVLLWHGRRMKWSPTATYWAIAVPLVVVLGTATHAQPDRLGLAHISLQPLVLLALVWMAARADELPRWLGRVWALALALDLSLGVGLHFAVQSLWPDRWLQPGLATADYLRTYTVGARVNWRNKTALNLVYLGDQISPLAAVAAIVAAGIAVAWLYRRAAGAKT